MGFNLVNYIETCATYISQNRDMLSFVYYSHIPTSIAALVIGFFVFLKNKKLLASKILVGMVIAFALWCAFDLILWTSSNSLNIMLAWSLLGILTASFFILGLYFFYAFIDKKDISFSKKIILGILLLPVIVLTASSFNLKSFDVANCQANEGNGYFSNYYYLVGLAIFIWILVASFLKYKKTEKKDKGQFVLFSLGIELFLLSVFITGFLNSYLVNQGYITDIVSYKIEQYGLFGMAIFLGFLAFLIVRYHAFNIKLIATQALVAALIIIIGAELFFAESATNQILILVTLAISLGFGYMLIKSVKLEVQRKEQLQEISDRLAQANDKLRQLDNAKTEFVSIASHQLRTPLTAVKGFVSLLLEGSYGKIEPEVKDILDKVYASNERLINLVEDLLNISRIESGRMEYQYEKFQIADILREIYDTFVLKAKNAKLKFEMNLSDNHVPEVESDKGKIREVISNFVDNAIKYTPKGWVRIKLEDRGEFVRVAVTDTGLGVPEEERPYLFSKFSRGKDTTRLNTGGTGLGLHVGKMMTEALGGRIGVESAGAGQGSTFFVEVPKERKEEK